MLETYVMTFVCHADEHIAVAFRATDRHGDEVTVIKSFRCDRLSPEAASYLGTIRKAEPVALKIDHEPWVPGVQESRDHLIDVSRLDDIDRYREWDIPTVPSCR